MELLFGYDRVRPEAERILVKAGVDTKKLARLSRPRQLGLCPKPGNFEFRPNLRLAQAAKGAGFTLNGGGLVSIYIEFDYTSRAGTASSRELHVSVMVPQALQYPQVLDDISEGLFGTCNLSKDATDFLHAHGISLQEIQTKLAPIPATSRVSPRVAAILSESGFTTDRMGAIKATSMESPAAQPSACFQNGGWSKGTCC